MAGRLGLAILLTTKYADGIPLSRFEKMLSRHGVDIPRQSLARWLIQCGGHMQSLLNLMRGHLVKYPVLHCDETRLQVVYEPGRDPMAHSRMWVQTGGPPDKPVIFLYSTSCAQDVPLRLLNGFRGYLVAAVAAGDGIERQACWAHARQICRSAEGAAQRQDRTGRHGAAPDQQALQHRAGSEKRSPRH